MSFMRSNGPQTLLKDGAQMVDEPIMKNILAAREMAKITRSSMGPKGLCKMVINHMNKLIVTHDAFTIMSELDVEHPAAKLLVHAATAMQQEVGDGTNLVVTLAGEFLSQAESLVRMGLHASDIIEGYKKASNEAITYLEELSCGEVSDVLVYDQVFPAIRTAIASKQYGYEDFLGKLVTEACINACPSSATGFNVDNIRIVKLDGDSIYGSALLRGFVIPRSTEGSIKHVKDAKIAVFGCAVDIPTTETKGNALIENAEDLLSYSEKEENVMEAIIKKLHAAGTNCVVGNANFGDLALHYLNRYGIMAVKIASKFELRRLCTAIGARVLSKLDTPCAEDFGHCDNVDVTEMGGKKLVCFAQTTDDSKLSTIVIRGATQNSLDDIERALDDGINVFKALTKDKRLVAGAGALEMEIQRHLSRLAEKNPGLDQYAMRKFAASFEIVARTLAEVSGFNGTDCITQLEADHYAGKKYHGINVDDGSSHDVVAKGIVDPFVTKYWAIRLASETALTVLQVDQIIVAKQAGGPKPRKDQNRDEE